MKKHYTNRLMVLARHLGSDHFIEAISGASPVYTTDFTVHGIEYFG